MVLPPLPRPLAAVTLCLFVLPAPSRAQDADGVVAMCTPRTSDAACACGAEALMTQIGPEDYAMYGRIGLDYTARMQGGTAMVEAWDGAVEAEAETQGIRRGDLMKRTNELGRAFRDAIRACEG